MFDIFTDVPENEKADYVVNTYIKGSATFPPEIWTDPDIDSKRTMNGCEVQIILPPLRLVSRRQQVYLNTYL